MKKLYFLLFLLFSSVTAFTQQWAPVGAKWFHSLFLSTINGYMETKVESDTILNGTPCKRVSQVLRTVQMPGNIILNYQRPEFYTYEDSGKIYVSDGGLFHLIQDWNAQPGDTVPFLWDNMDFAPSSCDSIGHMIIDSLSTVNINGVNYRQQYVHYYDSIVSLLPINDVIIEHFGATRKNFFFSRSVCDSTSIIDVYNYIGLTCYYDPTINWAYFISGYTCDYLSGSEELIQKRILIYPNPASEIVRIYYPGNASEIKLQLMDITGKIVLEKNTLQNSFIIDVSKNSPGYYFLKVHSSEGSISQKLLIN